VHAIIVPFDTSVDPTEACWRQLPASRRSEKPVRPRAIRLDVPATDERVVLDAVALGRPGSGANAASTAWLACGFIAPPIGRPEG
jgi:hypothetical protein